MKSYNLRMTVHTPVGVFRGRALSKEIDSAIQDSRDEVLKFRNQLQASLHTIQNLTLFSTTHSGDQEITFPTQVLQNSVVEFDLIEFGEDDE